MKTTLIIQNLKCGGCAHTITSKVSAIKKITEVQVDVEMSSVSFVYETDQDLNSAKEKLTTLGYPIEGNKNSMVSKAKSFVSCATGKMAN
jgi:copper chaperone CopZ